MSVQTSGLLLAWCVIVLLAFVMAGLVRQVGVLRELHERRMEQLGPVLGEPAPSIPSIGNGVLRSTVVIFVQPDCKSCARLLPGIDALAAEHRSRLHILLLSSSEVPNLSNVTALPNQKESFDRFQVPLTPFAVSVDPRGIVRDARPLNSGSDAQEFVFHALEREVSLHAAQS